jgi:hypothetical protein
MDIYTIRRRNLAALQQGYRHKKDLAEALDIAPSYLSQLLAHPGTRGSRNIGENVARKIEKNLRLVGYSLDKAQPHLVAEEGAIYKPHPPRTQELIDNIIRAADSGQLSDAALKTLNELVTQMTKAAKS